jgi:hypothetical protein
MADKHSEINKSYEIVYDNCGIGDYVDNVSGVDYIKELPILFSDEYQFLGWYKDKDYKVEASLNEKLETDIVLYAKWEKLNFTSQLDYSLSEDGTYYIVYGLTEKGIKDVVIPSEYEGLLVKEIGEGAFMNQMIESIKIPSTVEAIDGYALSNCPNLKKVIIGSGLKEIDKYAFCNNPKLESIIVDRANNFIDSREGCNAIIDKSTNVLIKGCKTTIIPDSVVLIEKYAFYGCSELTYIVIPDSVTTINESAFHSCTSLETIVISKRLVVINNFAFTKCESLKTIFNNSNLAFNVGDKANGNIALYALNIYNVGEWSYQNGTPTPNN